MIAGLQKMTLLDYPGKVACTVFLAGCNFRCPFCHNSQLLGAEAEKIMDTEQFLTFLKGRRGLLDAVCVSGGEPTLTPGLEELLRAIKALGYSVKLDTNGSCPQVLKALVAEGLVDYVAMDVKNSPARYGETVGVSQPDLQSVEESLRFLLAGNVGYELRTTVVLPLHDDASITEMGRWVGAMGKPAKWYLQKFTDRDTVIFSGLSAPEDSQMTAWRELLSMYAQHAAIRGE